MLFLFVRVKLRELAAFIRLADAHRYVTPIFRAAIDFFFTITRSSTLLSRTFFFLSAPLDPTRRFSAGRRGINKIKRISCGRRPCIRHFSLVKHAEDDGSARLPISIELGVAARVYAVSRRRVKVRVREASVPGECARAHL